MAYNAVAQRENDAHSDSDYSEIRGSPVDQHRDGLSHSPSPSLELRSLHSDTLDPPRTVSRHGSVLRHPTPGLQSLQGAYVSNIERLEQSAERLSMSSDIGEELRKMKMEQREGSRARQSFNLNTPSEEREGSLSLRRQFSQGYGSQASNSIVSMNNAARSGGFSSAAYFSSPRASIRSGSRSQHNSVRDRSLSQGVRLTQVTEPQLEGKPLDSPQSTRFANFAPPPEPTSKLLQIMKDEQYNMNDINIPQKHSADPNADPGPQTLDDTQEPRPSTDTYRQARGLFSDFDGTHHASEPPPPSEETINRRRSSQMLNSRRPQSYMEPVPGENMVYYPAPVPMMLNLPPRLSKLPASSKRDNRRSELLGSLPAQARKSAAWLPDMLEDAKDDISSHQDGQPTDPMNPKRRTLQDLPPQLRASVFFDYPSARQNVQVKGESAVATLDSILDASAFAPVTAFTDHPIAGHVGAEVYERGPVRPKAHPVPAEGAKHQKRKSSINVLSKRNSSANLVDDTKKRRDSILSLGNHFSKRKSSGQQFEDAEEYQEVDAADLHGEAAPLRHPDEAAMDDEQNEFHDAREDPVQQSEADNREIDEFIGQPTTLLAELQLRKQQQKQRNRTAATAFPDGMHSTLLQLDAVAQIQKQARQTKHTTLAWEDPDAHRAGVENEDDEDVPLAVLYPGRKLDNDRFRRLDEDRPLGLIARREMEDNEPLSHRRARLRGEEPSIRIQGLNQRNSMYTLDRPKFDLNTKEDSDDDHPNETLAQRIKRLKATRIPTQARPVSGDFASEMMSQFRGLSPSEHPEPPTAQPPALPTTRTPDLDETLAERRARLEDTSPPQRPPMPQRRSMADLLTAHPAAGAGTRIISNELKVAPAPKTRNTPWALNVNRQASMGRVPMAAGVGVPVQDGYGNGGYHPHPIMQMQMQMARAGGEGDARKGDMIDRWRQSVMY